MKLAYIIYNERPNSGLLNTQVISVLKTLKLQYPNLEITLIAFWQPWIYIKYLSEYQLITNDLKSHKIRVLSYPFLLIPSRHFLFDIYLFPILHSYVRILFKLALKSRYDIVHCRSYFSSLLSVDLQHIYNHSTIFDMRSFWPLEHITINYWTFNDPSYLMWKSYEKYISRNAHATVSVSQPMFNDLESMNTCRNPVLIPLSVDTNIFKYDKAARCRVRSTFHLEDKFVVAYEGHLGVSSTWNNIHNYIPYFKYILQAIPSSFFFILTSSPHEPIFEILSNNSIPLDKLAIISSKPSDLYIWLSAADAGIYVMSPGPDSHTRLGVKTVEYLSCGLPIIVNSNVGAAADLVQNYDIGIVLDLKNGFSCSKTRLKMLAVKSLPIRNRCRTIAISLFAVSTIADKYYNLYTALYKQRHSEPPMLS